MLNATIKSIAATVLAALALASCGDKDKAGATELFSQSEAAIASGDYAGAMTLLDTLNSRYAGQTEIRRQSLRLRAEAMQGIARDSIATVSRNLAEATLEVEKWSPEFTHVTSSVGLDGYFIPKGTAEKMMTATGIQARVSEKGLFYIVVNVQGKAIGLNSLEFVDGAEQVSSSDSSSSRVVSVEGSETASFNPEDLEGVGQWLMSHPGVSKVVIRGSKGNASVKVDAKLRAELTKCYEYSCALQAQRLASIRREKFERMLATARDQIANMQPDKTEE